jgi:hypothetical protein
MFCILLSTDSFVFEVLIFNLIALQKKQMIRGLVITI